MQRSWPNLMETVMSGNVLEVPERNHTEPISGLPTSRPNLKRGIVTTRGRLDSKKLQSRLTESSKLYLALHRPSLLLPPVLIAVTTSPITQLFDKKDCHPSKGQHLQPLITKNMNGFYFQSSLLITRLFHLPFQLLSLHCYWLSLRLRRTSGVRDLLVDLLQYLK